VGSAVGNAVGCEVVIPGAVVTVIDGPMIVGSNDSWLAKSSAKDAELAVSVI
jgi:hypothetical protein